MTKIRITDLSPLGSELFQDCESFLEELTDETLDRLVGARGSEEDDMVINISSDENGKIFKGIKNFKGLTKVPRVGKKYRFKFIGFSVD